MEFCRGRKVDDLEFLKERGISEVKVAKILAEVFAEMIFVHGFLHGDLHPGNILVSPEGENGFSVVLLDFGICKQLNEDFRLKYCELWEALLRTDGILRSLTSKLGAPLRVRLLAYAEYALYGLSLKADSKSDSAIEVVLFRFKIGLRYIQLRLLFGILGIVSWLENIKHTSTRRFKDFLASAGFVVRSLYRPLLTA
ncbi:hypothetical protein H5410_019803 [Solanum commersonii]|uniref:Protein kinase domain-containing protein n=1 Tax=Solanum commersonii TaxID=4109 RepID=A0A9J5Z7C4_SOLCO|nr:hypothetical protein H5410_019803 [Solanum commersonii]